MKHDPLCPFAPWPDEHCYQPDAGVSVCSIIAKVREDMSNSTQILGSKPRRCVLEYEAGVAAGRAEALGIRVREVMPYANGYFDGEDHMLAKCIAAVEAVSHDFHCTSLDVRKPPCNCPQGDALDALRALQEKPSAAE
jgi:hypothetical protein